jgi:transcriptional regulator with XRE-family HTH domain
MARNRSNKSPISLDFGNALKEAREHEGLSHEELAQRLDMSPAIISLYETGQRFPKKTTLGALEREVKASLIAQWGKVKPEWDKHIEKQKSQRKSKKVVNQPVALRDIIRQNLSAARDEGRLSDLSSEDIERVVNLVESHIDKIRAEKKRRNKGKR